MPKSTRPAPLGRAALALVLLISLFLAFTGCENNRREYLLALENNDRCIEQAHVVRRDLLNNLKLGNFAGTESASKLQISLQEKLSVAMYSLDRYRPRNPDPVAFEKYSRLVADLEAQRDELQKAFDNAYAAAQVEEGIELSKKLRTIELQLADASEKLKQAKSLDHPSTASTGSRSK